MFTPRWIEKGKRLVAPVTAMSEDGDLIGDEWAEFTPDDPEFEELASRAVEVSIERDLDAE